MSTVTATNQQSRRFSVDEYHRLAELGILQPDEHLELIDGQIYQKHHIDTTTNLPQPRRFSELEYYQLGTAGILGPEERVELLDGEIIVVSPIGSRHAVCVNQLSELLHEQLAKQAVISCQNPIHLPPDSEPEPDLYLAKPPLSRYRDQHPTPVDLLLVIEIADTTWEYDSIKKLRLYAQANISEYWIVNLNDQTVMVFRQPLGVSYQEQQLLTECDILIPQAFSAVQIPVSQLF